MDGRFNQTVIFQYFSSVAIRQKCSLNSFASGVYHLRLEKQTKHGWMLIFLYRLLFAKLILNLEIKKNANKQITLPRIFKGRRKLQ